jgi:Protein of unknown function (DUF2726)/Topoisomerase DNA binding C4 zinc finger
LSGFVLSEQEGPLSSLILVAIVLVALGLLATRLQKQNATSPAELSFESRGELFTPAERSFLGVLQQALGEEFAIFGKVRLGDVVQPVKGLSNGQRQSARNKINLKHLDYLICRADNLSLVAAVELDDKSHQRKERGERDTFVEQALKSAGIPLLRFPAKKGYELIEVKAKLNEVVRREPTAVISEAHPAQQAAAVQPATPKEVQLSSQASDTKPSEDGITCPVCQAAMVKRQAKKGTHAGNWFWACSTFPKCRKVVAIGS